ncbi:MAG TPA: hypothetical protein VJ914_29655 [Pseudonocardiaceae bacterium]|nr:hypothetical protein [Pseudonocardiaceae bacterium]
MTSDPESSYRAIENLIARYALLVDTGALVMDTAPAWAGCSRWWP